MAAHMSPRSRARNGAPHRLWRQVHALHGAVGVQGDVFTHEMHDVHGASA